MKYIGPALFWIGLTLAGCDAEKAATLYTTGALGLLLTGSGLWMMSRRQGA